MNQKQNEIKVRNYTYKSDIQDDLISSKSLLREYKFTDALDFDQQFEGVPAGQIIFSGGLQVKKRKYDDDNVGIWIGLTNDNKAKMFMGDPAGEYIKWDGSTMTISGTFTAPTITGATITGSTITGGTIQTAATGYRLIMSGANNAYEFRSNNTLLAHLKAKITPSSGDAGAVLEHGTGAIGLEVSGQEIGGGSRQLYLFTDSGNRYFGVVDPDFATGYIDTNLQVNGHWLPYSPSIYNLGSSVNYWNEINYKTLTDRGCLGWFDEGVELRDGSIVSDVEAIQAIKKHPTKKTVYGKPMMDYKTFPKVSYKKAKKGGADGVEMTSMFSIMFGAIKELDNRLKVIEKKL